MGDLQSLMTKYNDEITNYQDLYQTYIHSLASTIPNNLKNQLQVSNDKINNLNSQILYYLEQIEPIEPASKLDLSSLMTKYKLLETTRNTINDKTKELGELKRENTNNEMVVSQYYTTYLFLIGIVILLLLLLFKIASKSQVGGGRESRLIPSILFILSVIILFIIIIRFLIF